MIRFAREALGISESVAIELSPIEGRGSDRTFSRLNWNRGDSAILIHYDPKREENRYYADIAAFFREIDVPGPRLIRHDPAGCLIVMEDLGIRTSGLSGKPSGKLDEPFTKRRLASCTGFIPSRRMTSLRVV